MNNDVFIGTLRPKRDIKLKYRHQDGHDVEIQLRKEDKLLLIEKSNDDWWKCMREEDAQVFYVPSTYVLEELNEAKINMINNDKFDYENAEAIISDLEEHLDRELNNFSNDDMENDNDDLLDDEEIINNNNHLINDLKQQLNSETSHYQNLIPPKIKERTTIKKKLLTPEPDYDNDNDHVDVFVNTNNPPQMQSLIMSNNNGDKNLVSKNDSKKDEDGYVDEGEEEQIIDGIKVRVPEGWLCCIDKSNRKYFYNKITKAEWYLHKDTENKPYFYNKDGESMWTLPEQNNNEEEKHFSKNFDDELTTFKKLHDRNSFYLRKSSSNSQLLPQVSYSYKPPITDTEKFKIVKLAENKQPCRKSKAERYRVELASSKLLFIKENSKQGELAWYLDFKGGKCYRIDSIEHKKITQKLNSSKNAFLVETLDGRLIAFLNENTAIIDKWVSSINSIITQMQSEFSPIYEGPESLHCIQNQDGTFNPTINARKDSPYEDDTHVHAERAKLVSNDLVKVDKFKYVKDILIAFLKKRPNLDLLKQRGIYQECVFGCDLVNLCQKEKRTVPFFVEEIIRAIEKKGVDQDGLYRISGNLAEVQKLRCLVDQGKYNFAESDIHVLTGTLKSFFREIEDPIIPKHMQEQFVNALSVQDKQKKFQFIKEILKKLPVAHRETLKTLLRHLLKVIGSSTSNRMHLQNISLVFGPTICRIHPLDPTHTQFSNNIMIQNELVEYILYYFNELFDEYHRSNSTNSSDLKASCK